MTRRCRLTTRWCAAEGPTFATRTSRPTTPSPTWAEVCEGRGWVWGGTVRGWEGPRPARAPGEGCGLRWAPPPGALGFQRPSRARREPWRNAQPARPYRGPLPECASTLSCQRPTRRRSAAPSATPEWGSTRRTAPRRSSGGSSVTRTKASASRAMAA